ncbi:type IIB restriction/modification system, specificity subunit [Malaciobacter marinus]|uniref:Type IIB restriction/modification system, specificity subunit n=1 Tax=Malaciobacter marinus TaxID=505249 RepID=A0A347TMI9_9BACT|nr:restriction endonuclease subunit S [Malaciobacter marinus]AXX87817.1 type IIB restriction/modification system, specificity subunit [Malaciobacter marinus]PHO16496.1 hypothetical protein CPH92_01045 [Malaciobacter marinus]
MDGLEVVELKLSKVLEVDTFRLDSDYVQKKYLHIMNNIKSKIHLFSSFSDLSIKVDASAFYPSLEPFYNKGNIPFLRVADVDTHINYDNCVKIPKEIIEDDSFKTLKVIHKGDIVITKGGSIARVGLIEQNTAVTRDLIFLNSSQLSEVDYKFLYLYLLSNTSYNLMIRSSSMTAQPHLTIGLTRELPVFNPNNSFKLKVVDIYNLSKEKLEQSKTLYKQAEELLLKELDLLDFKPSKEQVSIKSFSESFGTSGRLDSEYYQPKYDDVIEKVTSSKYDTLGNIVNILKSVEPGSEAYQDSGIPFVRVSNLTKFGLSSPDIHLSENLFDNETLEKLQPKRNTILLSKDGTVGIAYNIKDDTNIVTSGALLHLTLKKDDVLPEYLTLVLNSIIVQMQSERDAGGSIIKHWKPSEIAEVLIPIIDINIQTQIEEKIKESFKLKEESKQLLEVSKRAVEIAIEDGENVSMEFINAKV